jgi:hypothetical protein
VSDREIKAMSYIDTDSQSRRCGVGAEDVTSRKRAMALRARSGFGSTWEETWAIGLWQRDNR